MFGIDDPTAVAVLPTPEAAGTPGFFTEGNPGTGVPATYVRGSFLNMMQQELLNVVAAAGIASSKTTYNQVLAALNARGVVVGQARNVRASQTTAGTSLTITADELVLKSALGGTPLLLANFNKTVNISTTGAGGMDTGSAPVSGWVGIYAIWNITSGASALLAVNATSTKAPEVYGGANMPAGYTHSCLVLVAPTNASSQIPVMTQIDREVYYYGLLINTSTNVGFTALSMTGAVPRNAWRWKGNFAFSGYSASQVHTVAVCPTTAGQGTPGYTSFGGYGPVGGGALGSTIPDCAIFTPQTCYYALTASATVTINCYGYTF